MSTELVHVPFHGGEILAVKSEQGEFAVIKPLCESIGIDANGQVQRLKRQGWAQGACMMHVPTAGGAQEMFCLPRNRVGMWLVTLDASRVRPEVRPRLTLLQNEAADVLDAYFSAKADGGGAATDPEIIARRAAELVLRDIGAQGEHIMGLIRGARRDIVEGGDLTRGAGRVRDEGATVAEAAAKVSDMGDALSRDVPFDYLNAEIIGAVSSDKGRRHLYLWLTGRPAVRRDFHPGREHLRRVRLLLPLVRPAGLLGPILSPPPVGAPNWRLDGMILMTTIQVSGGAEWYHVSYSRPDRVPSHEDTCAVRAAMFKPDALVIAVFPPADEYVNEHPYCLHLWQRLGPERLVPDLRVCEGGLEPSI